MSGIGPRIGSARPNKNGPGSATNTVIRGLTTTKEWLQMSLPRRVRFEILRRDNHACRYCGAKAPRVELEVDHVIPRHHGGTDHAWNLTAACVDCNRSKGAGIPHDDIIRDVRQDEVTYQRSKGLPVFACIHCSKPLQHGPDEDEPLDCETCNTIACAGWDAGFKAGRAA